MLVESPFEFPMRLQLFVHGRSAACKKTDFSLQFQDASIDWTLLVASIKRQLIQNLRLQKDDFLAFQYVDDEGDTVTVRNPRELNYRTVGVTPNRSTAIWNGEKRCE